MKRAPLWPTVILMVITMCEVRIVPASTPVETITIPISEDTTLSSNLPDNNFGELLFPIGRFPALRIGWKPDGDHYRTLMRGDVSTIPPGARIASAELALLIQGPRPEIPSVLRFHRISASWVEGDGTGTGGEPLDGFSTWNSRQRRVPGMQWDVPGGDFVQEPFLTSPTFAMQPENIVHITFPTEIIQSWLDNPSENLGFIIRIEPMSSTTVDELEMEFCSSEYEEAELKMRPRLVVGFQGGDKALLPRPGNKEKNDKPMSPAVTFEASLPSSGPTSLAIYDESGNRIVRTLWYGRHQKSGKTTIQWDGTNERGIPVSAGTYTWKALQGGAVGARYVSTIGNGRQPWTPEDVGGYDTLNAEDVAVDEDGYVYLSGQGHGKSVMKLSPEGRIIWSGPNTGIVEKPSAIALADQYVYAANANYGWYRLSRQTGKVVPLADGTRIVALKQKPIPADQKRWEWYPAYADYPTRHVQNGLRETRDTRGLVVLDGKLYLPFYYHHQVRVYDVESGEELTRWPVIHPAGMTTNHAGHLLIATERRIAEYSLQGVFLGEVVVNNLGIPEGLAVGPSGNIYVTDLSLPNTIKVFSPEGQLVKKFGTGESLQGRVKHNKLYMPFGIDVGKDGHVYIAEWLLERVQKLTPDWKPVWSVQSNYAENCCADRRDPSLIYGLSGSTRNSSVLFEYLLDYETGKWTNQRFWSLPAGHPSWHISGYVVHGSAMVELEGHRFYYVAHDTVNVFRMAGDSLTHVARIGRHQKYLDREGTVHQQLPGYGYGIWLDADGNGTASDNEISVLPEDEGEDMGLHEGDHDSHILDDGTVYYGNASFDLQGVQNGVPQYDFKNMHIADPFLEDDKDNLEIVGHAADPKGNIYYNVQGRTGGGSGGIRNWQQRISWCNLRKVDREGDMLWSVGAKARTFKKPGTWYYNTSVDWADGFLFAADEAGPVDIYREDGLYVSTVLLDSTRGHTSRTDVMSPTPSELFQVAAYRHPENRGFYLLCQSHEGGAHVRAYEVLGLDAVKHREGMLNISPELAGALHQRTLKAERPIPEMEKVCFVMFRRNELSLNGDSSNWPRINPIKMNLEDSEIECEIILLYDGEYYYVAATCQGDETPGVNTNADFVETCWSGDALELYVSGDSNANPNRTQYTKNDFQIILPIHGNTNDKKPIDLHGSRHIDGGLFGTSIHPDRKGWTVTARIPWSYLGDFRPVADSTITGGFKINLGDRTGSKTTMSIFWSGSGRGWVNPSQWGKLKMQYVD